MNFNHCNRQQTMLLPYWFDDLIPYKHLVRIVDKVAESTKHPTTFKAYGKEGNPGCHPKMLNKVMLYAYMTNVNCLCKIKLALHENINFIWLTLMTYCGSQYN